MDEYKSREIEIDELIKQALEEYIEEIEEFKAIKMPEEDKQKLWNNLFKEIEKGFYTKKQRRFLNMVKIAACVILLILTVQIGTSLVQPASADNRGFFGYIAYLYNNTVNFVFNGDVQQQDVQEPNYNYSIDQEHLQTLKKAEQQLSFDVLIPKYMPKGYELDEVSVVSFAGDSERIILVYIDKSDSGKNDIVFSQDKSNTSKSKTDSIKQQECEHKMINGNDVYIMQDELKNISAVWNKDGVNYDLFAKIEKKDEVIKIIESIN